MMHIAHAVTLIVLTTAALVFSNVACLANAAKLDWSDLHPNRPRLPLTVQFPTIHSIVEHEAYYRQRAAAVPELMTYDLVEEVDNPDLKPKRIRSKLCSLIGWCGLDQPTCDADCQRDSYLGVIRITNRKSAKKEQEKKKVVIVSSPNGAESIGTDMWIRLFVKYFTFDWDGLEEEVGLDDFWNMLIPYYFDKHLKEMGGFGLYKEEPSVMTKEEERDSKYVEDDDIIDYDKIKAADIKGDLIDWSKEILDEFVIVIIPLVSKAARIKVEMGDYCKHNGTEFWGPYWDFDVRTRKEPFMEKEQFFQTRLVSKIVRSEKPSFTISLNADGKYGLLLGPGGEETLSDRPHAMKYEMQKHVENVNWVTDIGMKQKAYGVYVKSGAMIDYFFEVLRMPLAIEFDIYHPNEVGLGTFKTETKRENMIRYNPLTPSWFSQELNEFQCMQIKHPLTPHQKSYMMMRWLVAFHELARQRMRAPEGEWAQQISDAGKHFFRFRPALALMMALLIGFVFIVRNVIEQSQGKRRGKMYRGRRI